MTSTTRRTAGHGELLSSAAIADMRSHLPDVAEATVAAIIEEVPSYTAAFTGNMGEIIRNAVQLALGGFLSLAGGRRGADPASPTAPAMEGAYQLGRGEARSGRTTEALLSAYRIGARVAWREMSRTAVSRGLPADTLADFAGLVFAYIDELSAASVAGHTDELATSGRVRQQYVERLGRMLLRGDPPDALVSAAERAEWSPPRTLTAVILPLAQARRARGQLDDRTLQPSEDLGEIGDDALAVLLVPDAGGPARARLLRTLADRSAVVGPAVAWLDTRTSYLRSIRALPLRDGSTPLVDTDAHLAQLVVSADARALADLRARALAPFESLRPGVAEKLKDTLRSWLLHHGRREDVAEALFVHPQTVRYRMGQLRELYGDRLDDPETVLELTLALA